MSEETNHRVQQWKAPERPEWVRRVNEEGKCLDIKSVVPPPEAATYRTDPGWC